MRILFLGDVVGRSGRKKIFSDIDKIVEKLNIDFTIVNAENSAHGFGINPSVAEKFFSHKIDVITTGDHIWDQMTIKPYLKEEKRILRPANYNKFTEGEGYRVFKTKDNKKVLVVNLLGNLFIERDNLENPFTKISEILNEYKLGKNIDAIFIDIHAEATSEKMSLANYVDGKVSAVIGTHTHIPTSDGHILPGGTAFQSDAGMCGDYDSSIGMNKTISISRFLNPGIKNHLTPSEGEASICGVIVDIAKDGLASSIEQLQIGGKLKQTHKL